MKGSGKTYLTRQLVARAPRLLVLDETGDYAGGDLVTFTDPPELARAMVAPAWRYRLAADLSDAGRRAYLEGEIPDEIAQLGGIAAWLAWAASDCVLVLDELADYCSPDYTPANIKLLASKGRHRRVSLLGTSRRPAEISRHVSAMADLVFAFHTEEQRDLDYLRSRFGARVAELPRLAIGHCLAAGDPAALALLGIKGLDSRRVAFVRN